MGFFDVRPLVLVQIDIIRLSVCLWSSVVRQRGLSVGLRAACDSGIVIEYIHCSLSVSLSLALTLRNY